MLEKKAARLGLSPSARLAAELTIAGLLDRYLASASARRRYSVLDDKSALQAASGIVRRIGAMLASEVTIAQLQLLVDRIEREESPNAAATARTVLDEAFAAALRKRLLRRNPAADVWVLETITSELS